MFQDRDMSWISAGDKPCFNLLFPDVSGDKKKNNNITGELWQTGWQAFNRTDKNTSHPVFGTFRLTLTLTGRGRDTWPLSVCRTHRSFPSSLCSHSEARNSWRSDTKVRKAVVFAIVCGVSLVKHLLLVWYILSRLNRDLENIQEKKRKEKENSIQSKAKKKSKRNPERTPLLCSCWGWLQFVSIGCICWDIQSHKVCKRWVV